MTENKQFQLHPSFSGAKGKELKRKMEKICEKTRWNMSQAASIIIEENVDKYLADKNK